jgi:hypothetical protein
MAEQQLIDYITKAKSAGQSEDQTKNLLYKNGWTEIEVGEAFASLVKPEIKPEVMPEAKPELKPDIQLKPAENKVMIDTMKAIDQLDVQQPLQPVQPMIERNPEPEVKPQEVIQPVVEIQPVIVEKPQPEPALMPEPIMQPREEAQPETRIKIERPVQSIQPQYSMGATQDNMPRMKSKSHGILKVLIVLIILIVVGGAGYMVAGQYINLWNPFSQSPEQVISKMMSNMATVKSYHSVMNVDVGSIDSSKNTSQGKLTINTTSDTDSTDSANLKANGGVKISLVVPGFDSPIVSLNMDTTLIGTTSYLRLSNIVLPPEVTYPGLSIPQLDGKWFQIDENTYKVLSQAESESITATTSATTITQADSLALAKKVQDLVASEKIFADAKKMNDEVVDGQNTYHYSVTIGKDKIKSLINKIMDLGLQEAAKVETKDASNTMVQDIVKSVVGSAVDSIGDITTELWIGKNDYMLYQYKFDKSIDLNKVLGTATIFNIKVVGNNSNFNTPVVITTPEGAQKIEEIVLPLLKVQKVNSKLTQIGSDAQSLFSDTASYSSLCNRGLVNGYLANYGTDLVTMHTDIVNLGAAKPACYSSVKSYCVSTKLVDGTYICVDSAGANGTTQCVSADTVCK